MSLHKLINLCQCQAGRPIGTNDTSTASDACHWTPHELCAPHFFSVLKLLLSTKPLVGRGGWSPHNSSLELSFWAAFWLHFPIFTSQFKLTLKTCCLCVAEFQALLLILSVWTRLHLADGKKGKQLICVPCKAPASALRPPQLHALLSCSVYTYN